MTRPRIAITMGDPAGIGPEICVRLLQQQRQPEPLYCVPIIFGDRGVLERVARHLGCARDWDVVSESDWEHVCQEINRPTVLDLARIDAERVIPGHVDAETGRAAYGYVDAAIRAAQALQVDAVATGPINKEAIHAAGIHFPGHTEIFAAKTHTQRFCMMQTCREITCSFVTTHIGYAEVTGQLSRHRVLEVIELSHDAVRRIYGKSARLLVCGLNPHAGESGLFGEREEERFIIPAIRAAQQRGIDVAGPYPPDTAFLPTRRAEADCIVCMYHDQGHIPLKALAFDVAVNVTLGLPIIRTSVDHGTALDIAWQGIAQITSLTEAVKLASRLAVTRGVPLGT